jgi:hypothetical protein
MKFVALPTKAGSPTWIERGDPVQFLALPMPGERTSTLAPVPATVFPSTVPMEQLIKWWWRVREWKIVATHSQWGGIVETTLSLDESHAIDEEVTMLPTYGGEWTGSFIYNDGITDNTVTFNLRILALPDNINLFQSYYMTGDFSQILPYLRLKTTMGGTDGNMAYGDTGSFYEAPDSDYPSDDDINGEFDCLVDGVDLQMPAVITTGSGFETGVVDFVLTPSLYWQYANQNGSNPKWNSLTGALL